MAAGCTVATMGGPNGEATARPRIWVTRKSRPSSDWAAVAPRQTIARGTIAAISSTSQGRQARISTAFGFLWMRGLPRSHRRGDFRSENLGRIDFALPTLRSGWPPVSGPRAP